jgi:hypothetical protein
MTAQRPTALASSAGGGWVEALPFDERAHCYINEEGKL